MQNTDLFGEPVKNDPLLREKFIEPPFSILNARSPEWQRRKKQWRTKGIRSEVGRDTKSMANMNTLTGDKYGREIMPVESIFDPALCELMYYWYCPDGGRILDPFAGGSVRGIVANYLGFKYTGIDIRPEQVASNVEQALTLFKMEDIPNWVVGDSNHELDVMRVLGHEYDLIFSCPPYADLEVYSEMPGDISNMPYEKFLEVYSSIIYKSVGVLKTGMYAIFVVGDIRDKKGYYRDFISHTKKAFIQAGAPLYNEAILLQPLGTAMLRAARVFEGGGKLTKVHENVLIFKKL